MLSVQESMILLEMLRCKKQKITFCFEAQEAMKNRGNFSKIMDLMQEKDLIRKHYLHTHHKFAFYDLTFDGEWLGTWVSRDIDTPKKWHKVSDKELYYDMV